MSSRLTGLAWLACLAIAGCSGKPSANTLNATAPPPMAQSNVDENDQDDPCSLLEPKEAEAVLGAPLGTPPYRASNGTPTADGSDCMYQTANFRQIIFTVEFTDGAQSYNMTGFAKKLLSSAPSEGAKKAFTMDDGTELAGEWDEAQLTAMNCCIFNALRGDQMISIDFTGTDAKLPQAASLVDAAYKRIDKPLKLDGAANVAAAQAFLKTRPKPIAPCSVLSQSEVEAIVGPLISPPVPGGTTDCEYKVPPKGGMPRSYELHYIWRGGYADIRSTAHIARVGGMAVRGTVSDVAGEKTMVGALGEAPPKTDDPPIPAAAPGDPWERAGLLYNDFVAIKKDVEVKIDHRMLDDDKVKALVAAAMRKF
jgi:hypothetical protein